MKVAIQIAILSLLFSVFAQNSYTHEPNPAPEYSPQLKTSETAAREVGELSKRLELLENKTGDKFDIFAQLLVIFIGVFVGIAGALVGIGIYVYRGMRKKFASQIKEEEKRIFANVKKKHADLKLLCLAEVSIGVAYGHWMEYEGLWKECGFDDLRDDTKWTGAKKKVKREHILFYLDLAIQQAKWARDKIDEMQQLDETNKLNVANSLMYFLATRRGKADKAYTVNLARILYAHTKDNIYKLETCSWVFMSFGSPGEDEFQQGYEIVSGFLKRSDLDRTLRQKWRLKYSARFPGLEWPEI